MASSSLSTRLTLTSVVISLAIIGLGPIQGGAQTECRGLNIGGLISECGNYVQKTGPKTPPSPACCGVVKNIDVQCACKYVNKDIENLVSVDKAVYVARYCGVALKHGSKCGSYTIP